MKILKRNYGHRNLIFFLILSLVYLQAIYSLSVGRTMFSRLSFHSFFIDHYLILILTAITIAMVINIKKYSERMLLICLVAIVGKNFLLLSSSFNKLTLGLNFIFLVFAFYFYITWELEVALSSFTPNFSKTDLEKESRFKLKAIIFSSEDRTDGVESRITNIDGNSCFLLLANPEMLNQKISKKYYIESIYEDVRFQHTAHIVSTYDRGIGLAFIDYPDARFSWSELYKVCLERGIVG